MPYLEGLKTRTPADYSLPAGAEEAGEGGFERGGTEGEAMVLLGSIDSQRSQNRFQGGGVEEQLTAAGLHVCNLVESLE